MDQALLSQLIKSYGAADTPENTNRIRDFYGANPDQAERRIMGMTGTSGQQGAGGRDDVLNAMLDKVIQQSAPAPTVAPEVSTGNTYSAPARGAAAPALPKTQGSTPSALNTGPLPARDATASEKSAGDWSWLLPILLGGAGVASLPGRDPTVRAIPTPEQQKMLPSPQSPTERAIVDYNKNNPRLTYQPKLENNAPSETRNSPELEAKGKAATDNYAKLQAEIDAENQSNRALMDEMAAQRAAQERTRKLGAAARAVTGRR